MYFHFFLLCTETSSQLKPLVFFVQVKPILFLVFILICFSFFMLCEVLVSGFFFETGFRTCLVRILVTLLIISR